MDWFNNPFMGLGGFAGDPTTGWGFAQMPVDPGANAWETFSTEGMIGENVNPLTGFPEGTVDVGAAQAEGVGADTDKAVSAQKKGSSLADTLKGLKAPEAPKPQTIRSPEAPRMAPQKSHLSTILASMGVTPASLLRLSQSMGR